MAELAQLRCALYGEWQEEQPPGGQAVAGEAWRWFFFDDGSGVRVPVDRDAGVPGRAFIWFLEGRNLRLSFGGAEGTQFMRIDSWSAEQLIWFDFDLDRSEVLLLQAPGRRPSRCTSPNAVL